jgi:hypothetical protein
VSELLPVNRRGLGTTIVATVGVSGALAAGSIGEALIGWSATEVPSNSTTP